MKFVKNKFFRKKNIFVFKVGLRRKMTPKKNNYGIKVVVY